MGFIAVLAVPPSAASAAPVPLPRSTAASVPLPDSMAAAGDSITQAFDVDPSGLFQDNPAYSWATGTKETVDSEYERILAANPAIKGHKYNEAFPGDRMSTLDRQVKAAASHGVQYLAIEIGADDLCVSTVADMTPTATFQSEFQQALTDFTAADPGAHIFVASIPNVYLLWQEEHTNVLAQLIWDILPLCTDMLESSATSAQRQQIVAQEQAYNRVLGEVCAEFSQCRFDNDAVYDFKFTTADISSADYFHPSPAGQRELAKVAWSAGFWSATAKRRA